MDFKAEVDAKSRREAAELPVREACELADREVLEVDGKPRTELDAGYRGYEAVGSTSAVERAVSTLPWGGRAGVELNRGVV